jgi:hypothetical protein
MDEARTRQVRQGNKILTGNHEGKNDLGDLYVPGGVNIKWILNIDLYGMRVCIGCM